jgi:dTDP-4-amino-4,6-dideoxygalactose transaminase
MFEKISEFENKVAEFYGAPYAVATDCCTHAIELCIRATECDRIEIPTHTYISIPFTAMKTQRQWVWKHELWQDYYFLGNTNIIDAAVFWKQNGYISGTLMALSFHFKKHLSTVRGGMILLDDHNMFTKLQSMSYDGRNRQQPWREQMVSEIGFHYYMSPETAELGLSRLENAIKSDPVRANWQDYPYLPNMPVFKNQLHV